MIDPAIVRPSTLALFLATTVAGAAFAAEATVVGPAAKCLGVAGAPAAGAAVVLETCDGGADQLWQLPERPFTGPVLGGGGLCLDVAGAAIADPTAIQLHLCHGGANQQWRHLDDGRLVGLAEKCLDIEGAATADGSRAVLFACHGGDTQIFQEATRNAWGRAPIPTADDISLPRLLPTGDPRIAYLATERGLLRSDDGASTWSKVRAERAYGGFLRPFLVDRARPDRLFAFDAHTMLRSDDGGRTWAAVLDDGRALIQSPDLASRYYAATNDGFYRSLDGGATFQRRSDLPIDPDLETIDLDMAANGDFYLLRHDACAGHHCGSRAALYRSRDLGASWTALRTDAFVYDYNELLTHPTESQALYWVRPGADPFGSFAVERSSDSGATWQVVNLPAGGATRAAAVDRAHPDDLWVARGGELFRSRDRGLTWTEEPFHHETAAAILDLEAAHGRVLVVSRFAEAAAHPYVLSAYAPPAGWTMAPIVSPTQEIFRMAASAKRERFYASSFEFFRTDDGGRTWLPLHDRTCASALAADPLDGDVVYLGKGTCFDSGLDRALYRSRDAGATFEPLGPPSPANTLDIAAFPWQGDTVLIALVGGYPPGPPASLWRSFDQGENISIFPLPGAASALWVGTDQALYASDQLGSLYVSHDLGANWHWRSPGSAATLFAAGGTLVLGLDPANARARLSGDHGLTWAPFALPRSWAAVTRARIEADDRIFLINEKHELAMSADLGRSWRSLAADQPDAWVGGIAADPHDEARLLLATAHGPYVGRFLPDGPAVAEPPPLALGERFEARLAWRDAVGGQGRGHGSRLTDDTGIFWLFTPERAEVTVKLLDARALNGRFWIFVAGLTNVEFELEILDRVSGERRRYHNPLGTFSSFGDTAAFPRGDATPASSTPPAGPKPLSPASAQVRLADRYRVEVAWRDFAGQSGEGQGFPLSRDTAGFYFFDPDNVELLVNLIDGRPINGHVWVFFAGLSNVEYRVTVTDTATGTRRIYENAAGTFASFGDTLAF